MEGAGAGESVLLVSSVNTTPRENGFEQQEQQQKYRVGIEAETSKCIC